MGFLRWVGFLAFGGLVFGNVVRRKNGKLSGFVACHFFIFDPVVPPLYRAKRLLKYAASALA